MLPGLAAGRFVEARPPKGDAPADWWCNPFGVVVMISTGERVACIFCFVITFPNFGGTWVLAQGILISRFNVVVDNY